MVLLVGCRPGAGRKFYPGLGDSIMFPLSALYIYVFSYILFLFCPVLSFIKKLFNMVN